MTIGREAMNPTYQTVVGPALTRQPAIDSMLNDMALISQRCLQKLRNKVMDGLFLDRDELREFKELCETVLRQTRVEMEVETHTERNTSGMSPEQVQATIQQALTEANVEPHVTGIVLKALGMKTS